MNSKADKDFTTDRIKHLKMILSEQAHMANSSAWVKRMTILIVSGIIAVSVSGNEHTHLLSIFALYVLPVFWFLDASYHYKERSNRELYDAVRNEDIGTRPDFRMVPVDEKNNLCKALKCIFHRSVSLFYIVIAIPIVVYILLTLLT